MKKKTLLITFIISFCIFINAKSVKASTILNDTFTETVISKSNCSGINYGREINGPISSCMGSDINETTTDGGMLKCLQDTYPVNGRVEEKKLDNGNMLVTIYDIGRMDTWGNLNGLTGSNVGLKWKDYNWQYNFQSYNMSWNNAASIGSPTCPGMNISYRINHSFVGPYASSTIKNFKVENVIYENLNEFNDSTTITNLQNFSISDYNISDYNYDGDGKFHYQININNMSTRGGYNGLGMIGVSGLHGANVRSFHYYIPIKISFEYNPCDDTGYKENNPCACMTEEEKKSNTECDNNPCTGSGSQAYAFGEGYGKCCYEYPETCCFVEKLQDSVQTPWIYRNSSWTTWKSYYASETDPNYAWQGSVCCQNEEFKRNNVEKCGSTWYTISDNSKACRSKKKYTIYTTSYITFTNDYKTNKYVNEIVCRPGIVCSSSFKYSYELAFKYTKSSLTKDNIGFTYFDATKYDDYQSYIDRKTDSTEDFYMIDSSGNKIVETGGELPAIDKYYRNYSLKKGNFSFELTDFKSLGNDLYSIKITITVLSVPAAFVPNSSEASPVTADPVTKQTYLNAGVSVPDVINNDSKAYYVPLKIFICHDGTSSYRNSGSCRNDSDYYPGNNCCTSNPSHPNCDTAVDRNTCEDKSYFNKNKALCCAQDSTLSGCDTDTIPDSKFSDNLTCDNSSKAFANTKEVFNNGNCSITCTDNLTMSEYNTSSIMKNNVIKAGTGFEYPIKITNNGNCTLTINAYNKTFEDYGSAQNAEQTCKTEFERYINQYNDYSSYNMATSTQQINFDPVEKTYDKDNNEVEDPELTYKYVQDSFNKNYSSTGNISPNWWYKYWTTCGSSPYTYSCQKVKKYDTSFTKTYSYNYDYKIELPKQYISKVTGENTINSSYSTNINYVEGYNYKYTSVRTDTGIYNFNINISNGGLLKNIKTDNSSTNNKFSCQYGVENKYIDNGDICIIGGVVQACPSTDDYNRGYFFRTISLLNPFPNTTKRSIGSNWNNKVKATKTGYKYINWDDTNDDKNENVYLQEPMYEIELTSDMITAIKLYNRYEEQHNDGYSDWTMMRNTIYNQYDSLSKFVDVLSDKRSGSGYDAFSNAGSGTLDLNNYKGKLKIRSDIEANRAKRIGDF